MLLGYSVYLIRAVVSAMVATLLLFVGMDRYMLTKYRYARIGVAMVAILDCMMDIWGCYLIAKGIDGFIFHWTWVPVYYIEWTVLGFCVMKLIESPHGGWWFPPLMLWFVIADSLRYAQRIDDVYAGTRSERLHKLSLISPVFLVLYITLNIADLSICDNLMADLVVVALSTVMVVWVTLRIFNLEPETMGKTIVMDKSVDDQTERADSGSVEAKVREWEMRSDKPFCKEDISLYKVADQMHVSSRVLSSYINSVKMVNFNTWINGLRVEEIKRLIRNDPDIDCYDIMVSSGFQSRASLTRAVKQSTGMTLTELKKQL